MNANISRGYHSETFYLHRLLPLQSLALEQELAEPEGVLRAGVQALGRGSGGVEG